MKNTVLVRNPQTGDYRIEDDAIVYFGWACIASAVVSFGLLIRFFYVLFNASSLSYQLITEDTLLFFLRFLLAIILLTVGGCIALRRHSPRILMLVTFILSVVMAVPAFFSLTSILASYAYRPVYSAVFWWLMWPFILALVITFVISAVGLAILPKAPAKGYYPASPYVNYPPAGRSYPPSGGYPYGTPGYGGTFGYGSPPYPAPPPTYYQQPQPVPPTSAAPSYPAAATGNAYTAPTAPQGSPLIPTPAQPNSSLTPVSPEEAANPLGVPSFTSPQQPAQGTSAPSSTPAEQSLPSQNTNTQ